ncbi:MAG: hypothetical protein M1836_001627 [Candelina mexicana]|nr:MAG: hypothetical protein M1836_001627 [Candelina mexicana]
MTALSSSMGVANASTSSTSQRRASTTSQSVTLIQGTMRSTTATARIGNSTINGTATTGISLARTSSSEMPTNTQPCNNWPEFCERKYSNITEVTAHNSMFVRPGNAASNQELEVIAQLNDGIRMLQGQSHLVNGTMYFCHTTCHLLNGGTVESYFRTVTSWIEAHPYDVVTILIGNSDFVDVGNYTDPIESSGLSAYAYTPPLIPMGYNDWPTLSSMILTGKRAVIFMDYKANQDDVPYILDEFSQMWETPFSPTNDSFPCTVERPPGLSNSSILERMYMANHNLNTEITLLGSSLLVPTIPLLNQTNNVSGHGSLGLAAKSCTAKWNRPPRFLLVDYYNVGNGSVFEVAAQMNNVNYTRSCCGLVPSLAVKIEARGSISMFTSTILISILLVL